MSQFIFLSLGMVIGVIVGAYAHDSDISRTVKRKGHTGFALWTGFFIAQPDSDEDRQR